jgi:voltage-gated potassium channel
MHPFRSLVPVAAILAIIFAVGIVGYMVIERWTLMDSAYMVVITLFTIGFEEVHPLSTTGRSFTMLIAVTGVGTAVYAAGRAVQIIVEGEMSGYRREKRMANRISRMEGHYIICGFGRVGHQVAEAFEASRFPYVVIDSKQENIDELELRDIPNILGDATADQTLVQAGIDRARGLIACSDSDVANVYVTLSARALNPKLHIVARAGLRDTEKKLIMAGANRVISPYRIAGRRMAALATRPVASDFLDLVSHGGHVEFRLHEITVPKSSPLASKTLGEAEIRSATGVVVLAIRKLDGSFNLQPSSSSRIHGGDLLVALGTDEQIELLQKLIGT